MNEVNKTLYIPLYGKAQVSKKGIILQDKTAERIWEQEGFQLKGKAKSKWLTYYMGMRAAVFDEWLWQKIKEFPDAMILHVGCGMDARVERIHSTTNIWYDIDFPSVIQERGKYYQESAIYHMLPADAGETEWIGKLPETECVIVVMEGVSMYLEVLRLQEFLKALHKRFKKVFLLMDCYTVFAAKASKYKNPVKDVGAMIVSGIDQPKELECEEGIHFVKEWDMTPKEKINELPSKEQWFFQLMFGGKMAKKIYRLFEYELTVS